MEEPLLLVQGPPGTGKPHTLAWAILARCYAAATLRQPWRVLVSAFTHNALDVVLRSLVDKLAQLERDPRTRRLAERLRELRLFKEVPFGQHAVPAGVELLRAEGFLEACAAPLAVIWQCPPASTAC